ncbi:MULTISPECIES: acyltransferase family protein [Flavobacterium]|uniref:Acyltransferase n=1 Tax=Flavobacterium cupriresistens TaxID=2893885 RepID=A0ABU4RBX4_9FLAO|nr:MULTISPECIES: acyltransferase [unclassified Flavobacterium]MDX6190087.1 acyltransferase [Flavobacterium sp. Fl-318]UFH42909.1 acyltransferase [Flavobacterium sp. F-323]
MKDKIYFPNLNGLRSIAAFMVIFSHLELNKGLFGISNHFQEIKHIGKLGVSLFFVLSGFLITFLLLMEKGKYATVAYKKFYTRRILRIWPLYFVIVILSLGVLPFFDLFQIPGMRIDLKNSFEYLIVILLFVFFLPNLLIQIKIIPFAAQTWSIGTEEQFYLIWPWIINNVRRLSLLFIFLIFGYNALLYLIDMTFLQSVPYSNLIIGFIYSFQLDALTIGAMLAYLMYSKHPVIRFFTYTPLFIIVSISTIVLITLNFENHYVSRCLYPLLFGMLILCLVYNPQLKKILENRILNYLGKISYGLYMYHQIVIVLVLNILFKLDIVEDWLIYILSIILTIIISGISYRYIETPFLNKKKALSVFNNEK